MDESMWKLAKAAIAKLSHITAKLGFTRRLGEPGRVFRMTAILLILVHSALDELCRNQSRGLWIELEQLLTKLESLYTVST